MKRSPLLLALLCTALAHAAESPAPGAKYKPHDMARPQPRVVTPPNGLAAPSDATVLFDGRDLTKWKQDVKTGAADPNDTAKWKVADGYFEVVPGTGTLRTREKFKGDTQWHLEFATPSEVQGNSQKRGNSGVFIGGFPEVQVLDSFQNPTYPDGSAAALYGKHPPMVNASRKPGEWQTYDIIVERERKDEKGAVVKKARITVIHNGIVVQWARETGGSAQEGDLSLQDHGNPIRFRNIWVRPINLTDPDSEGTPLPAETK